MTGQQQEFSKIATGPVNNNNKERHAWSQAAMVGSPCPLKCVDGDENPKFIYLAGWKRKKSQIKGLEL